MLNRRLFTLAAGSLVLGSGLVAPVLSQELTPVRFTLDWRIEGPAAGFMLARDNGYFAEEGLDVTFDVGNGSVEVIPRVATGAYQMGFGDINSLIKFLDEDANQPIKAVMMIYETPTFSVVGRSSLGVTDDPASLEGKTLGAPPPDGAFAQWPAFVEASGIDTSDITIESIGFPVREPMLAQGDVDAVFGFAFSVILNLKAQGIADEDIVPIMMADHGLELYGNSIMVNTDFAEANPEVVEGMLRAIARGFADAVADPAAGAAAVVAANDILDINIETERLTMANDMNINTAYVQENGFGGIDFDRLDRAIAQLDTSIGIASDISAADVFDDSFLPPAEDRMFN